MKTKYFLVLFILTMITIDAKAQIEINQDERFEQLLKQKNKSNSSLISSDRYKIQVFSGDNENSRKTLNEVKKKFTDLESTIVFQTPNYKVWVGNFKNKIDAERVLIEVRSIYNNAFIIKPSKL